MCFILWVDRHNSIWLRLQTFQFCVTWFSSLPCPPPSPGPSNLLSTLFSDTISKGSAVNETKQIYRLNMDQKLPWIQHRLLVDNANMTSVHSDMILWWQLMNPQSPEMWLQRSVLYIDCSYTFFHYFQKWTYRLYITDKHLLLYLAITYTLLSY